MKLVSVSEPEDLEKTGKKKQQRKEAGKKLMVGQEKAKSFETLHMEHPNYLTEVPTAVY